MTTNSPATADGAADPDGGASSPLIFSTNANGTTSSSRYVPRDESNGNGTVKAPASYSATTPATSEIGLSSREGPGTKQLKPRSSSASATITSGRKRGRPKGSKNKKKCENLAVWAARSEVLKVAELVGDELRSCSWPGATEGDNTKAAVALEKFALEVFLPNLLSSVGVSKLHRTSSSHRPFLATLLMLREVMIQNSELLFGIVEEEDGNDRENWSDERCFRATLYATGVVMAAVDGFGETSDESHSSDIMNELTSALDLYDSCDSSFMSHLRRVGTEAQGFTPGGSPMDREESVAWRVSYNLTRQNHPLVVQNEQRNDLPRLQNQGMSVIPFEAHCGHIASPNACFVTMVKRKDRKPEASL